VNAKVEALALSGLGKLREKVRKYPILSGLLSSAMGYYASQYGPAIRGGIKLVAPYVGLTCSE
jgi:hypothetical protein